MATLSPIPVQAPWTTDRDTYIPGDWLRWLYELVAIVSSGAQQIGSTVNLTNQSAAIASTPVPLPALANGLYRLSWYARVTAADGVSSSLGVSFTWTDGGVSPTKTFTALTGDTTTTADGNQVIVLIDQNTPVNYATSYASNTPNKMHYKLSVQVEAL